MLRTIDFPSDHLNFSTFEAILNLVMNLDARFNLRRLEKLEGRVGFLIELSKPAQMQSGLHPNKYNLGQGKPAQIYC